MHMMCIQYNFLIIHLLYSMYQCVWMAVPRCVWTAVPRQTLGRPAGAHRRLDNMRSNLHASSIEKRNVLKNRYVKNDIHLVAGKKNIAFCGQNSCFKTWICCTLCESHSERHSSGKRRDECVITLSLLRTSWRFVRLNFLRTFWCSSVCVQQFRASTEPFSNGLTWMKHWSAY